jgi:hypothetical protein
MKTSQFFLECNDSGEISLLPLGKEQSVISKSVIIHVNADDQRISTEWQRRRVVDHGAIENANINLN